MSTYVIGIAALGVFCIFILAVGGAMVWMFARGAGKTAQAFANQPAQRGEEFLASAALRPWESSAWGDLSSRWAGWWRNVTSLGRQEGYTQGIVKSLQKTDGPGWLAFTIQRQQVRNAILVLKTSAERLDLKVTARSHLDRNVQAEATINGAPAGSIAVTYPTCVYHSADGKQEARWTGELRWNNETYLLNRLTSREVRYDDLVVNGRRVAALTDTWIRYPHPESTRPFHPALQSVAGDLNQTERGVLLVALGMALYYDSLRNRQGYIYDW